MMMFTPTLTLSCLPHFLLLHLRQPTMEEQGHSRQVLGVVQEAWEPSFAGNQ